MRSSALLWAAALGAALTACGGGGNDNGSSGDPSVWHFRGVNVIQDAPNVQFYVDGTAVENADYGAATAYHPAHTGTRPLKLAVRNPSDLSGTDQGFADIGSSDSFDFQGPTDYTLVASGTVAEPRKFLITGTSTAAVEDNRVNYQFINAAVGAGSLEVFITAPEAGIAAPQAVGTLDQGESSPATDLTLDAAAGAADGATRSVHITLEVRDGATTVFQSNAFSVAEQNRLLFIVTDNAGPPNVSRVKVFLVGGTAAGAAEVLLDSDDGAELRFANLSPDAGAMDLIVSKGQTDVNGPRFAPNIAFGQQSPYGPLEVDTFNSIATPAGNSTVFLFVNNFTTGPARSYTLYAQGPLASPRGLLFVDDRRSVPTEARFRLLHASPTEGGGALDVYVRRAGTAFDLNATSPPAPTAPALAYRNLSGALALKPGTYDVYLARAGAKTPLIGPVPLVLAAGAVETVALVDSPLGALELLPVDDARP